MQLHFMDRLRERGGDAIALLGLIIIGAVIAGCGSSGSPSTGAAVSPQVVNGVAATGAPLVGQVTVRDSSSPPKDKVAVIANDGSFAVDVADMQGPFLLKATGTADGVSRTLFSFADQPGTANVNPLSSVALANAAGVDDPSVVFDKPDSATLDKIKSGMDASLATLRTKLMPLLNNFGAANIDPVKGSFAADHDGLDGMFDNVKFDLSDGTLTITNVNTGAVIFTAQIKDLDHGEFTENSDDVPESGPRPAAPTGVQAVGGEGQVTISWDPVANATSYDLFYATRPNVAEEEDKEAEDAKRVTNVTSPFVLKGLAANTTYYFIVRALIDGRRGPPSAEASATTSATTPLPTAPAAPTGVTATGGTKQVTVSWLAVTGATTYNLYWSTTTGVTTANGTKISGVTSPVVHTGLADNTTYFYVVTAENSAGESAASVQVAATTLAATPSPSTVPAAPTGVTATGGDNQVTLSWSPVTDATSYNIYWATTAGVTTATGTRIAGVTSPYVHTALTASTTYYYVVTAVNSAGESDASLEATATTNAAPLAVPAAPTGVTAVGGTQQVTVSWNAVSGATSYNLYWSTTSGVTTATGTKIAGVTSPYVQTGLADGATFFYIVTAVNSAGESVASSEAAATTSAAAINGATLYLMTGSCVACHGGSLDPADSSHIIGSAKQGATAAQITSGIANIGSMNTRFNATTGTVIKLTPEQITAIATALQ